jgi:hypothetical protein
MFPERKVYGLQVPIKTSVGVLLNTYRTHPFIGLQEYYYRIDVELDSPEFWLWVSRVCRSAPKRFDMDRDRKYMTIGYFMRGT